MQYIDTRDLAERKEELESLEQILEDAKEVLELHKSEKPESNDDSLEELEEWEEELKSLEDALHDAMVDFGAEESAELSELVELSEVISEFYHGETMIPVDDFEDYAKELAYDIGAVDKNASWPNQFIDWEAAADALAMDYNEVSFQGVDYYVRD